MPRIGAALAVVATLVACIAVNTHRYPAVREMVAAVPPFQFALRARDAPKPDSAAPEAKESAARPDKELARAAPPARETPRPFDLAEPPLLPPKPSSLASSPAEPKPEPPPAPVVAASPEPAPSASAAPDARPATPSGPVTVGQLQAGLPLAPIGSGPVAESPPVPAASPAASPPPDAQQAMRPRIVQVRARPADFGVEPQTAETVERLPPVDQVWPAERAQDAPPPSGRLWVYPTTGVE